VHGCGTVDVNLSRRRIRAAWQTGILSYGTMRAGDA
jgi:hypothetical protein